MRKCKKNPTAINNDLYSEKGSKPTGRVPGAFLSLSSNFTFLASGSSKPPQILHPNCLYKIKLFSWALAKGPGIFHSHSLALHWKWSDAKRNIPLNLGGWKGYSPLYKDFFSLCWGSCYGYWHCSLYDSNPSFPHRSLFFMSAASIEKYFFTVAFEVVW